MFGLLVPPALDSSLLVLLGLDSGLLAHLGVDSDLLVPPGLDYGPIYVIHHVKHCCLKTHHV